MKGMGDAVIVLDELEVVEAPAPAVRRRRSLPRRLTGAVFWSIGSAAEWAFGAVSLVVGLSVLAALPILQFLSLGYLLEASARVARSGRLRDGVIGVRKAARVGSMAAGTLASLLPAWLVGSMTRSAELIDPGGYVARGWKTALVLIVALTLLHVFIACLRGGRLRHFVWPFGNLLWIARRMREGGLYTDSRDRFWVFATSLGLPRYFRLGFVCFVGTLVWIVPPAALIAAGGRSPIFGVIGVLLLAVIAPSLPFLQIRYAVEGKIRALFSLRAVRDRFRRAPWAFAFALMILLLASIPLYLLKIQMVPREAAWLPSLLFVVFLTPARILTGWAYARSERRERPRHWLFRTMGRLAIFPAAALYVFVVFFAQYTSWGGYQSLYEQHAFLVPVPFLSM